ncbi:MAG: fructosamine kinase family protein, partial [Actinomycetota bacterium]|nr:fructosamine kinase family protein [Actinomycetota bacterium]
MSALRDALAEALGRPVGDLRQVASGDLNDAYAAELDGGGRVFVKTAGDAAPGAFTREAEGLRWLAEPQALPVAQVLAVADEPPRPRFLALEWIERG